MGITPPTVNASYNPNLNEIVSRPALQPPFFDPRHDAVNMAEWAQSSDTKDAGFDDRPTLRRGGQFARRGTPSRRRTTPTPRGSSPILGLRTVAGIHINGELTRGKTSRLGGKNCLHGAQKALAKKVPPEKIDCFPRARFFLASPKSGATIIGLRFTGLNTDPHSPGASARSAALKSC